MGRYAVCEEEVDQLLRGEKFVDHRHQYGVLPSASSVQ